MFDGSRFTFSWSKTPQVIYHEGVWLCLLLYFCFLLVLLRVKVLKLAGSFLENFVLKHTIGIQAGASCHKGYIIITFISFDTKLQ